jgi:hypothetical protein
MSHLSPEITNQRAECEWLYILQLVGEERALAALQKLGNRRPFPMNVAKVLKITFPPEHLLPRPPERQQRTAEVAKAALEEMRNSLKGHPR